MMEWMSWTTPTAVFFIVIGLILVGMTTWELRSPSILRRGFSADCHHPWRSLVYRSSRQRLPASAGNRRHRLEHLGRVRDFPGVAVGCDALGLVESIGKTAPKS
jgi:hypothetical protein